MFDENWWEQFGEEWKQNMEEFKNNMQEFMNNLNEMKFFKKFKMHSFKTPMFHYSRRVNHYWKHYMPFMTDEIDKYVLEIPLRKYTKDEVILKVSQRRLKLTFQKKDRKPRNRYFPIPEDVEPEKTSAKVENNVLIINLYKKKSDISIDIE
ncbi:MAG: Hsp20/alpha crystallin family protein [Candidatus Helarchaeota archaeon]